MFGRSPSLKHTFYVSFSTVQTCQRDSFLFSFASRFGCLWHWILCWHCGYEKKNIRENNCSFRISIPSCDVLRDNDQRNRLESSVLKRQEILLKFVIAQSWEFVFFCRSLTSPHLNIVNVIKTKWMKVSIRSGNIGSSVYFQIRRIPSHLLTRIVFWIVISLEF